MKSRNSILVIISTLVLLALACGTVSDLGTVSDTGKGFMNALRDCDHETSWNLLAPAVQSEIGTYNDWVDFASIRNFSKTTFSSTNVSGTEATMEGEAILGSETYLVSLVFGKSGENWLITGIEFSLK